MLVRAAAQLRARALLVLGGALLGHGATARRFALRARLCADRAGDALDGLDGSQLIDRFEGEVLLLRGRAAELGAYKKDELGHPGDRSDEDEDDEDGEDEDDEEYDEDTLQRMGASHHPTIDDEEYDEEYSEEEAEKRRRKKRNK